jgi:hypothetical protein
LQYLINIDKGRIMEISEVGSTCMPKIMDEKLPVNPGLDVVFGCQAADIGELVFKSFFIQDKCIVWFCCTPKLYGGGRIPRGIVVYG